jgi:hypothetical protein
MLSGKQKQPIGKKKKNLLGEGVICSHAWSSLIFFKWGQNSKSQKLLGEVVDSKRILSAAFKETLLQFSARLPLHCL